MEKKITVLLADDHTVVREGCRRLLEKSGNFEIVGEVETGEAAYQQFSALDPDVIVMDLSMPGIGGLEAARHILAHKPKACILIFSIHDSAVLAERALQSGVLGFVTKTSSSETLVNAVMEVASHHKALGPDVAQKLALRNIGEEDSPLERLSPRELEIFRMVVEGASAAEIASTLNLANKTVSNYLHHIKQKLEVNTTAELVHVAIRHGLIKMHNTN